MRASGFLKFLSAISLWRANRNQHIQDHNVKTMKIPVRAILYFSLSVHRPFHLRYRSRHGSNEFAECSGKAGPRCLATEDQVREDRTCGARRIALAWSWECDICIESGRSLSQVYYLTNKRLSHWPFIVFTRTVILSFSTYMRSSAEFGYRKYSHYLVFTEFSLYVHQSIDRSGHCTLTII